MKITIIGSGVYGKSMANLLLHDKNEVTIWTEQNISDVIPPVGAKLTNSYEEALNGAELVYVLTGSKYTPEVFSNMKEFVRDDMLVILGSKGILEDGRPITEVFESIMPQKLAVISGPTFAVDIASLEPLGFTLATSNYDDYLKVKDAMKSINLEYSSDILGVEMAGSLKNAYAIGSGMLGGFEYGHSVSCLYITKVLNEMKSIFSTAGAKGETVLTLAGVGDLVLTCTSLNSRNFSFGSILSVGSKKDKDDYLSTHTVEGYENLKVYSRLLKEKNIDAPILEMVASIVNGEVEPKSLIEVILK